MAETLHLVTGDTLLCSGATGDGTFCVGVFSFIALDDTCPDGYLACPDCELVLSVTRANTLSISSKGFARARVLLKRLVATGEVSSG